MTFVCASSGSNPDPSRKPIRDGRYFCSGYRFVTRGASDWKSKIQRDKKLPVKVAVRPSESLSPVTDL